MAIQRREISSPDKKNKPLSDFASSIQLNLRDLFQESHNHTPTTTIPGDLDGIPGDIRLVEDDSVIPSVFYLYARFTSGWKRTTLS